MIELKATGAAKRSWQKIVWGSDNGTALTAVLTPRTSIITAESGVRFPWLDTENFANARIIFGATGSDGNTLNYDFHIHYRIQVGAVVSYVPVRIGYGVATLGSTAYTTSNLGTSTKVFADTITEDASSYSLVTVRDKATTNLIAMAEFSLMNAPYLEVRVDIATGPSAMDVFCQLY